MPTFRSNVRFSKGLRGVGWATAEYYGAKGSVSVDDRAALQAGLDDMASSGGGRLLLGNKPYRTDGSLHPYTNVDVEGVPGGSTYLLMNHATQPFLVPIQGSNVRLPAKFSCINFGGLVTNTGTLFEMAGITSQSWQFERCVFNEPQQGTALRGAFFHDDSSSASNEVSFIDCHANVTGTLIPFLMNKPGCRTNFVRGTYVMPSGFGNDMLGFYGGGGLIEGVTFDLNAHSTGFANCIFAGNSAPGDIILVNNARSIKSSGLINSRVFLKTAAGSYVRTSNLFTQGCTRFSGTGLMARGSSLDLEPFYDDIPGSLTYDIRSGYASVALWLTLTGNPQFNLPTDGVFAGQRLAVHIYNNSGSTIGGYTFGGLASYAPTAILNGRSVAFIAEYTTTSSGNAWVLVGTPLAPFIA